MRREVADLAIVGSGAGGALLAHRAALAGLNVLVVERGPWVASDGMSFNELDMMATLYKDGGLQMNASMDMAIMQGECVGGSTAISNMVMLRPDPARVGDWRAFGADLDDGELERRCHRIEDELRVAPAAAANITPTTRLFFDRARDLGHEPQWMPKAVGRACRGCGYCNYGCVFDTKMSSDRSYVTWAVDAGARVLPLTHVDRVEHRRGRVERLIGRTGNLEDPIEIYARQFVVAAGAIGSSALLLASGIRKNVGTRLSFNAGSMLTAVFDREVDGFDGDQMTSYLLGDGYVVEPTHNPIMSTAITGPGWFHDHGRFMAQSRNVAFIGCLVPTEATGRVVLSRWFGHEETVFQPSGRDLEGLHRGLELVAEVLLSAGAERVLLPTQDLVELRHPSDLGLIRRSLTHPSRFVFGSAHPMGGNPMSDDPDQGVVDSSGRVHGFDNLFVSDASIFPSGCGVNPIESILAVSDVLADRIMAQA
jgi:choline dehydrogenase-like flavoprotein